MVKKTPRREPEIIETATKLSLVMKGNKSSPVINSLLPELHRLRYPCSLILSKKHQNLYPLDDEEGITRICNKYQCSLFMVGSSTKKRPNNLILGRLYNHALLDTVEFAVEEYKSAVEFRAATVMTGIKPIMMFQGDGFETDKKYARVKSLFLDMFGGRSLEKVDTKGLNTLICLSIDTQEHIHFRCYQIQRPGVSLEEIGPRIVLKVRREKLADEKAFTEACKQPKLKKKVKNVTTNALREKRGRVHVKQQDISTIALKKRRTRSTE